MIDLDHLEQIAKAVPEGPWSIWTSNSWRRVYADQGREKVRVIEPTIYNHWPNLMFGPGVEAWLEGFTPEVAIELIEEVRRLREDASRYQWLKAHWGHRTPILNGLFPKGIIDDSFDAGIDAALAKDQP